MSFNGRAYNLFGKWRISFCQKRQCHIPFFMPLYLCSSTFINIIFKLLVCQQITRAIVPDKFRIINFIIFHNIC